MQSSEKEYSMVPSVAVVILNWNGIHLLEKFLPSVSRSVYPNLQIIVGDNASTDQSVAYIKANYPQIKLIQNDQNYGFAEGYNRILQQVNADYFVLLNSDVEVPGHWIQPVIDLMETDHSIAVAQPKIKWQKNKAYFEYAGAAGGYMDLHAFPFCKGRIFDTVEADEGQYDQATEIFWASGAAFFIKSKYWNRVGGLDTDLFAHMEEIDICWRLKNLGYKVMYCPSAEVYHVGGGTLNANDPHKTYLNFRNNLLIMQKNLPEADAYFRITVRFFLDFIAWLRFLMRGETKYALAITKAHAYFLKNLSVTARKRTKNQLPFLRHVGVFKSSITYKYFVENIKHFTGLDW